MDASDCGWGPGIDYTVVSKTRYQAMISEGDFSMSFACDAIAVGTAVCTVNQSGGNDPMGLTTATLSGTDADFLTASIVQGASLLKGGAASAAASTTAGSGSAKPTGPSMTTSGTQSSPSHASGSASASGSAPATASKGAAARYGVEGSALVMFAGAAALML